MPKSKPSKSQIQDIPINYIYLVVLVIVGWYVYEHPVWTGVILIFGIIAAIIYALKDILLPILSFKFLGGK